MLLRMLLVLIAVAGLSIAGCEKQAPPEPTPTEEAAEVAEEVTEEAAEETAEAAEEM